jgi:hypothetical protein
MISALQQGGFPQAMRGRYGGVGLCLPAPAALGYTAARIVIAASPAAAMVWD